MAFTDQYLPATAPTIRWILSRRGLAVVCETVPDGDGFKVVLTLRGHVIDQRICAFIPGTEEQVASWRAFYEAYGWLPEKPWLAGTRRARGVG